YFYDPDHDLATTELLYAPQHGLFSFTPYGTFTYTPDPQFSGTDRFAYKVSDAFGGERVGSVVFNVVAVNDAPVLTVPGLRTFFANTSLVLAGISARDMDVTQGTGQMRAILSVQHGTLTLGNTAGLSFVSGGNGQAAMTFTGSLASVNAALNN